MELPEITPYKKEGEPDGRIWDLGLVGIVSGCCYVFIAHKACILAWMWKKGLRMARGWRPSHKDVTVISI